MPSWLGKLTLVLPLLSLPFSFAALQDGRLHANQMPRPRLPKVLLPEEYKPVDVNGAALPPLTTVYEFDQLIDHNNPSTGTFKQRYWHTWEYYKPGGPIILSTPGEGNAEGYEGYLTNRTINGQIAQQQNGATIVLEHRFFGLSNPYPDLSVKSLQFLTLQQSVDDLVYFTKTVKLAMPGGDQVTPDKAPWVLIGGSYSGALTSWTMVNRPGVFWAGYSSSGVVEAINDFWQYFEPVRQQMPQNCSADVQAVIAHVDKVFTGKNTTAINELKSIFGMEDVLHLDDAAGALRNDLWQWQDLQISSGPNMPFYQFCDALELKDGQAATKKGWGLDNALQAWGNWFKTQTLPRLCDGAAGIDDCLSTYNTNQTWWTDETIDNAARSWTWMTCEEFGYWQDAAPAYAPTLVSRLLHPPYDLRQCGQMFPAQYKNKPANPRTAQTNSKFKGWNVNIPRLFFVNGLKDPWRYATVSSPNIIKPSTPLQPIHLVNGIHCSDLGTSGEKEPTILQVHKDALATFKVWLAQWKPTAKQPHRRMVERAKPVNAMFVGSGVM